MSCSQGEHVFASLSEMSGKDCLFCEEITLFYKNVSNRKPSYCSLFRWCVNCTRELIVSAAQDVGEFLNYLMKFFCSESTCFHFGECCISVIDCDGYKIKGGMIFSVQTSCEIDVGGLRTGMCSARGLRGDFSLCELKKP